MRSLKSRIEIAIRRLDRDATVSSILFLKNDRRAKIILIAMAYQDGSQKHVILRLFGHEKIQPRPYIAGNEFRLLQHLEIPNIVTPRPLYFDQSQEIFPTPYLIYEYLDGEMEKIQQGSPRVTSQMAEVLAKINSIDRWKSNILFLPRLETWAKKVIGSWPLQTDESLNEIDIRRALLQFDVLPIQNDPALLHGDFWIGNILWKDGKISGVIDWENAMLGDPVADLAVSRIDFAMGPFGVEAMMNFTEQYQSRVKLNYKYLPYWDLYAALRHVSKLKMWAKNGEKEEQMRAGHRQFVSQALVKLRNV